MPSLSHQKEKLERQQQKLQQHEARLKAKSQKLKTLERKQRTRRLIELGGLVVKAQLEDLNNNSLLGALLSLKQQMSNDTNILNDWTEVGARAFEEGKPKDVRGSTEKVALIHPHGGSCEPCES